MPNAADEDDLDTFKYSGTVVGNDNCLYGIPIGYSTPSRIVRFNPVTQTMNFTGEERAENFECNGGGVVG